MMAAAAQLDIEGGVRVKISVSSLRLLFTPCGPECNEANQCGGKCCDAPTRPSGCLVTIHPKEHWKIVRRGAVVKDGFIVPPEGTRGCPFKKDGLCTLHGTPDKPFGCRASPFTLNRAGTLIVRNRYKMLPCYQGKGRKVPAYVAFRSALDLLFGRDEAMRICAELDSDPLHLYGRMDPGIYTMLMDNDLRKKAL